MSILFILSPLPIHPLFHSIGTRTLKSGAYSINNHCTYLVSNNYFAAIVEGFNATK
jgi:S-adenosylmethionine hydrolase